MPTDEELLQEDEDQGFALEKQSNTQMVVIIGGVVVVILAIIGFMMMGGDPEPEPEPVVVKEEPKVDLFKVKGERRLKDAIKYNRENPDDYQEAVRLFGTIAKSFGNRYPEIAGKATEHLERIQQEARDKASTYWAEFQEELERHHNNEDFAAANAMFTDFPQVFEDFGTEEAKGIFLRQRKESKINMVAMAYLRELETKAGRYAAQNDGDIGRQILEFFPSKYEDDAPLVWESLQKTIKEINRIGIGALVNSEAKAIAAAKERAERKAREREDKRKKIWNQKKGSTPWARQLNRHSLYHWVVSSDNNRGVDANMAQPNWTLHDREGEGVIECKNTTGSDIYTGFFTSHWYDSVTEFQVKLHSGTLQISPRTRVIGYNPMAGADIETSEWIEFSDDDLPKGEWVTITVEVHGDVVEVRRSDGEGEKKTYTKGDEFELLSEGGIVFQATDETHLELRRVRTKLVSHSRSKDW